MAKEVLDTIMNIQPKDSGGGGGETRETIVYKLADDMLEKLPPDYLPHEVGNNMYIKYWNSMHIAKQDQFSIQLVHFLQL